MRIRKTRRVEPGIIMLGLLGLVAAPAAAQVATATTLNSAEPSVADLVARLDDESFAVRERATKQLLESSCDQAALYSLLTSDSLSLEQRYRLVRVCQKRLLSIPRGALGISMPPFQRVGRIDQPIPIEVIALIPGLPAERVLRVGDIITHIDGKDLLHQEELRNYVQLRRPGDVVHLTVRRAKIGEDGKPVLDADGAPVHEDVEVNLTLGSVDRLKEQEDRRNPGASDSQVYAERVIQAERIAEEFSPDPPRIRFPG